MCVQMSELINGPIMFLTHYNEFCGINTVSKPVLKGTLIKRRHLLRRTPPSFFFERYIQRLPHILILFLQKLVEFPHSWKRIILTSTTYL